MQIRQNRRDFLASVSSAAAAGVLGSRGSLADEGPSRPAAVYDDTPITARAPKLYLRLEEVSGSPLDAAGAGYAGAITVSGTPTAYRVETTKGFGIRLGTSAYIQAAHHAVFQTAGGDGPFGPSGTYLTNGHIESEVTFSVHCAFPAALQDDWVIFSKDNDDSDLLPGVSLRVMANGSVQLRVREHKYRPEVLMATEAGLIVQGSEHHFTVSLGYEGAWFAVDGRMAELGFKNHLAWWGLDHRCNGNEANQKAVSVRTTNTSAIRLGRTGNQSTSADIVVTKFAVFYSGATRITRGQVTPGFTLAACQALAGASGSVLPDPHFTAVAPRTVPGGTTNQIQQHIDACNAGGGGTVILNGNYKQSVDLFLRSRVRITTTSSAVITFTGNAVFRTPYPSMLSANALASGVLNSGASSYLVSNTLSKDAVFLIGKAPWVDQNNIGGSLGNMYLAPSALAAGPHTPAMTENDLIPIKSTTGTSITFARAPYFSYPTTGRQMTTAITNPTVDVAVDGNITFRKTGPANTAAAPGGPVCVDMHGIRRGRFNNITVKQLLATGIDLLAASFAGCVELRLNGCDISTMSTDLPAGPPSAGGTDSTHPYALSLASNAHYDVFNHTGYGDEWHAIDNAQGNVNADKWGRGNSTPGVHWGGQWGDLRKLTLSSNLDQDGNNFPGICHIAVRIRFCDVLLTSGGGISCDGWGHDFQFITGSSGGRPSQWSQSRGVGGSMFTHCTFNNNLGGWGRGAKGFGKNVSVNMHYLTPVDNDVFSRTPDAGQNTFIDVDTATHRGNAASTFPY